VGGDAIPTARALGFVGSIKWREDGGFTRADAAALAAARARVPGADAATRLVGVSRAGFDGESEKLLDVRLDAADLVGAFA
jgi:hypothetical protein